MKILITIPHYYNATNDGHGSGGKDPRPRIEALSKCLFNIYSLFSPSQFMIDIKNKIAINVNDDFKQSIDVIICTTGEKHLLPQLNIPKTFYQHQESNIDNPRLLGFECHKVLKENIGKYDYYCFMEDDLIIRDSFFFQKIKWFNDSTDFINVLQPNRYEVSTCDQVLKSYVDGDINPRATKNFQNIQEYPTLLTKFLNKDILLQRPLNPHSGCFFLSQKQMEYWINQPYYLDNDVNFISPLESSASLGLMKTFRVYKPAAKNANFFEIQHYGSAFLGLIGTQVALKNQ